MNTTTNPIQTLRNQGITINTSDKEATQRLQTIIEEMTVKTGEGTPARDMCIAGGCERKVGEK